MGAWLEKLQECAKKTERVVVGIISGTSVDSINVAVCRIEGAGLPGPKNAGAVARLLHFSDFPYDPALRTRIIDSANLHAREIAEMHAEVGDAFAHACLGGIEKAGLKPTDVDLIGSHGQTIYHHSGQQGAMKATLQLGDGDRIAEKTSIAVVSDFRTRDIAAGGEGAPLTPYSDIILFSPRRDSKVKRRAVLNLGGTANITILDSDPFKVLGFDSGPANSPLDRLARMISNGQKLCDLDGEFANAGTVNAVLLERLLEEDQYLKRPPPKSTGFELYGDAFVQRVADLHGGVDNDLIATITEFCARASAYAIRDHVKVDPPVDELVVAGGGIRNPALLDRLKAAVAPIPVVLASELGVPADAREAMGFAIFANEALFGHAVGLPNLTGARHPVLLGKWSMP